MNFKSFIYLILTGLIFIQCNSEPEGLTISGNVENAKDLTAYIDYKNLDSAIEPIANTPVEGDGTFSFNFPEGLKAGIYRVRVGARSADLLLRGDEDNVHIAGDINNFENYQYEVTGSEISETYRQKIAELIARTTNKNEIDAFVRTGIDPLLGMALVLSTAPPSPAQHANYTYVAAEMKEDYPDAEITSQFTNLAELMEKRGDVIVC